MLKTDFHTHAGTDKDHALAYSPKQLINKMSKLGYEVVSITNHDTLTFNSELKRYAKKKGILLIPGIEKKIEKKDVIILNPTKKIEKIDTFAKLEEYKKENVFVIAPHPYYPDPKALHSKLAENIKLFDGVEFSHFYLSWWTFNKKAVKIAEKNNIPVIGTSDCHMYEQLNRTFTLVDANKNIDSIFKAMRKRKTKLVTKPIPLLEAIKIISLVYFRY